MLDGDATVPSQDSCTLVPSSSQNLTELLGKLQKFEEDDSPDKENTSADMKWIAACVDVITHWQTTKDGEEIISKNSKEMVSRLLRKMADNFEKDVGALDNESKKYLMTRNVDIQDCLCKMPFNEGLEIWESLTVILVQNNCVCSSKDMDIMCKFIQQGFYNKSQDINTRTFRAWARFIAQFDLNQREELGRVRLFTTPLQYAKGRYPCVDTVFDTWVTLTQCVGASVDFYFEQTVFSILRFCAGGSIVQVGDETILESISKEMGNDDPIICPKLTFRSASDEKRVTKFLHGSFVNSLRYTKLIPFMRAVLGLSSSVSLSNRPMGNSTTVLIGSVLIMQIIRKLSPNLKEAQLDMVEPCISSLYSRILEICQGEELKKCRTLFLVQLKTWTKEAKLPFHYFARILSSIVDNEKSSECVEALEIAKDLFTKHSSIHEGRKELCVLLSSLCSSLQRNSQLSSIRLLAFLLHSLSPQQIDVSEQLSIAKEVLTSLETHVKEHEDINEGGLSSEPKFGTLEYCIKLPFAIFGREEISNVVMDRSSLPNGFRSLFLTVNHLISDELNCDCSTTMNVFLRCVGERLNTLRSISLSSSILRILSEEVSVDKVAKISGGVESSFDSIGQLSSLVTMVEKAIGALVEVYESVEKKTVSSIDMAAMTESAVHSGIDLVHALKALFTRTTEVTTQCSLFRSLSNSLGSLLSLLQSIPSLDKKGKTVLVDTVSSLLDHSRDFLSGPFDSELLSSCEKLFEMTIMNHNLKVRTASQSLWKSTFAKATTLECGEALRNILQQCVRKHLIVIPASLLNTDGMDCGEATPIRSPSRFVKPSSTPVSVGKEGSAKRSARKRPLRLALGPDEDSVDYPVVENEKKKIKISEKQKEKYLEQRAANSLFVDEDSRQEPMWKTMTDVFENDSSRSVTVQPTKDVSRTTESKPEEKKEKSKHDTVELTESEEVIPDSAPIQSQMEEEKEVEDELTPVKDVLKNTVEVEERTPHEASSDCDMTQTRGPTSASKRKTAMKLNFDNCVGPSSSASTVTSETMSVGRNRRAQAKGTPNKFVAVSEPRKKVSLPDSSLITTPKSAKRGRPRKRTNENEEEKKKEEEVKEDCVTIEEDSSPDDVPLQQLDIEESGMEESVKTNGTPEKDPGYSSPVKGASPVPSSTPSVSLFSTPSHSMKRVVEQGTPSILRKIGSPLSVDKKNRRVHFDAARDSSSVPPTATVDSGERVENTEKQTTPNSKKGASPRTPRGGDNVPVTPPSALRLSFLPPPTPSSLTPSRIVPTEMVFPPLADCKDPLSKIIFKLTPMAGSSSMFLRKSLESRGITTVGCLSRLSPLEISQLSIRKPRVETVQAVLAEYANKLASKPSPSPIRAPQDTEGIVSSPSSSTTISRRLSASPSLPPTISRLPPRSESVSISEQSEVVSLPCTPSVIIEQMAHQSPLKVLKQDVEEEKEIVEDNQDQGLVQTVPLCPETVPPIEENGREIEVEVEKTIKGCESHPVEMIKMDEQREAEEEEMEVEQEPSPLAQSAPLINYPCSVIKESLSQLDNPLTPTTHQVEQGENKENEFCLSAWMSTLISHLSSLPSSDFSAVSQSDALSTLSTVFSIQQQLSSLQAQLLQAASKQ